MADSMTLFKCGNCGYIEGEEAAPCCRKCGDHNEPVRFTALAAHDDPTAEWISRIEYDKLAVKFAAAEALLRETRARIDNGYPHGLLLDALDDIAAFAAAGGVSDA